MAEVNMDMLSINGIKPTQVIKDDNDFKIRFLDLPIDNFQPFFDGMTTDKAIIEAPDDNPFILSNVNVNLNIIAQTTNIEMHYISSESMGVIAINILLDKLKRGEL